MTLLVFATPSYNLKVREMQHHYLCKMCTSTPQPVSLFVCATSAFRLQLPPVKTGTLLSLLLTGLILPK